MHKLGSIFLLVIEELTDGLICRNRRQSKISTDRMTASGGPTTTKIGLVTVRLTISGGGFWTVSKVSFCSSEH